MPKLSHHFDAESLVKAIFDQPLGLRIVTNHPEGFRRLLYLHLRRAKQSEPAHPGVSILQCPKASNAFLLLRGDANIEDQK